MDKSIQILKRTPKVLNVFLSNLDEEWTSNSEGPDTWSPYDVVGHLIHGEKTDWIPRAKIIIYEGINRPFQPFDRFAQYENSKGKTLAELLEEFDQLRQHNIHELLSLPLKENLDKLGQHPELGTVTLRQLIATWATHDLNHIYQISRVMAKLYATEVGPWAAYLGVLHR